MKHQIFTLHRSNNLSLNVTETFKSNDLLRAASADFVVRRRRTSSSGSVGE